MKRSEATWGIATVIVAIGLLTSCGSEPGATKPQGASGTIVMYAPGYEAEVLADFNGAFADEDVAVVVVNEVGTTRLVQAIDAEKNTPVAIVSFGARATGAWKILPILRDKVRSAAFVSVPAAANLEVHDFIDLPILDLHSEDDTTTAEAHQPVHDALSAAGVPHEMVVYDQVQGDFFASGSPAYNKATAIDASNRTRDWVMTSLRTDDLREMRSG